MGKMLSLRRAVPENNAITLYTRAELLNLPSSSRDRLAQIIFNEKHYYTSWHTFTKLHRRFQEKFGRQMVGVQDAYARQVRATFNFNKFVQDSLLDHFEWVIVLLYNKRGEYIFLPSEILPLLRKIPGGADWEKYFQ